MEQGYIVYAPSRMDLRFVSFGVLTDIEVYDIGHVYSMNVIISSEIISGIQYMGYPGCLIGI